MKQFDPYKKLDPTIDPKVTATQGRTYSGQFGHKLAVEYNSGDMYPIDSNYWAIGARGAEQVLAKMVNSEFPYLCLPQNFTEFSWRIRCEMLEKALEAIRAGKSYDEAIQAAHDWLAKKQYETARALLSIKMAEIEDAPATVINSHLAAFFDEYWDIIAEVEI